MLEKDEIILSYDASSLFIEVHLNLNFVYIIDQIYNKNKLPPLSSKLLFRCFQSRITQNSEFSFNGYLYRQVDGCGMRNLVFPILANIFMSKLEVDIIKLHHPPSYNPYVDDCFSEQNQWRAVIQAQVSTACLMIFAKKNIFRIIFLKKWKLIQCYYYSFSPFSVCVMIAVVSSGTSSSGIEVADLHSSALIGCYKIAIDLRIQLISWLLPKQRATYLQSSKPTNVH